MSKASIPKLTKAERIRLAVFKTAKGVVEERLDCAGFVMDDVTIECDDIDDNGNVSCTVTLLVTSLDIEEAQKEGK